jgi:HSP20 family protein
MFGRLTNFEDSLFDDLRRMQHEMEEMYGPRVCQAGIRSVARGTYPPINVGANIVATVFLSATDRLS